jgi:hypothetical protein
MLQDGKPQIGNLIVMLALGHLAVGAVLYLLLGPLGDAVGPGWRDLLQGGFGLLWLLGAAFLAVRALRRKRTSA